MDLANDEVIRGRALGNRGGGIAIREAGGWHGAMVQDNKHVQPWDCPGLHRPKGLGRSFDGEGNNEPRDA